MAKQKKRLTANQKLIAGLRQQTTELQNEIDGLRTNLIAEQSKSLEQRIRELIDEKVESAVEEMKDDLKSDMEDIARDAADDAVDNLSISR